MELLLCKNIPKLGIVGDIVKVSSGYGRNYLLPKGLATAPTEANKRVLAEARKTAELERERQRAELETLAEKLKEVDVTIRARANEVGALYGSVGRRDIAEAMAEDGYYIKEDQVLLAQPIRKLDNAEVEIRLAPDLTTSIKVWVVREKTGEAEEEEGEEEAPAGMEAGTDDNVPDD